MTVYHCEHMVTQNIILTVVTVYKIYFIPVVFRCFYFYTAFGYHEVHNTVLGKKIRVHRHSSCTVWSLNSFLGYQCIEITSSSKIQPNFFPVVL